MNHVGTRPKVGYVVMAVVVVAMAASCTSAVAAEPTIAFVVESSTSATCDIAIALSPVQDCSVEPVGYAQADAATDESNLGGEQFDTPTSADRVEGEAESVVPRELLEDSGGPPTWQRMLRPIGQVTADATLPAGLLPSEVEHAGDAPRAEISPEVVDARLVGGWEHNPFEWSASKSWHRPLYFEEVNLERHGYQCHPAVQPVVSGAHFFLTVPTLPYQMTAYPPRECIYTLGHYRPGSCPPWQRHRLPWDSRAAAVQAGVTVGLVFLIP